MRLATSRSRKSGQHRSHPRRSFRPLAEALEDRLVLSHLDLLSESGSSGVSISLIGSPILGSTNASDSSSEFPGGFSIAGGDFAVTASITGGLSFGGVDLWAEAYAEVGDGGWGYTDKTITADASGKMLARIVPDAGERIGDPVRVVVSIETRDRGTGSFNASAGGLSQSGRYAAKIGDTIDLSASANAIATGGEPIAYVSDWSALIHVTVETPPPPNIGVTELAWDGQGGVEFQYKIDGSDLPSATTVALYWASGSTSDTTIGGPVSSTTTQRAVGTYGPTPVVAATLGAPPPGAHYLLAFADPGDLIAESDESESDNVKAVPIPALPTTVTVTSTSGAFGSVFGEPVTFTATVAPVPPATGVPTGYVEFYVDGSFRGSSALSGGVATFSTADLPVGDRIITAHYLGDDNFKDRESDPLIQAVHRAKTGIILTAANPFQKTVFGQKAAFNVQVVVLPPGAGQPSGLVEFFADGALIGSDSLDSTGFATVSTANLPVGDHLITASYHGDDNFEPSNGGPVNHSVDKAKTHTNYGIFNSPSFFGEAFTVFAQVEVDPPGAGQPTGLVHFGESGGWFDAFQPLAQGFASIQVPGNLLPVGTYQFQLTYPGDGNFEASSSLMPPHDVVKARTRLDLDIQPSPSVYGGQVVITPNLAVVAPGAGVPTGDITYAFSGGRTEVLPVGVPLMIDDMPAGHYRITATYSGDDSFSASVSPAVVHEVEKAILTVKADDKSIERGDVVPALTASITGFVPGEGPDDLRGEPVLRTSATSASPAGRYPIKVGWNTPTEDNYRFVFIDGSLTVHPKVVDVLVEWGGATVARHGARSMSLLGLDRDLPFLNIQAIEVIFSDPVDADRQSLTLTGGIDTGTRYAIESYQYNADTRTGRWLLARPLGADRLTLALDGVHANPDIDLADFSRDFAVLPGDFNGDRVVNSSDFVGIIQQILFVSAPNQSVWADLNGDNVVNLADFYLAVQKLGRKV